MDFSKDKEVEVLEGEEIEVLEEKVDVCKALSIDELKTEMFVTVLHGVWKKGFWNKLFGIRANDDSFKGRLFQIEAIQLPYVVVREHGWLSTSQLDMRCGWVLSELTQEYVNAVKGPVKGYSILRKED